ncbi:MAG: hypothetical protein HC904_07495 [Blastochloris sp.]|nr:hypothetical protein [Blastochloris sp.]
MSYEDAWDERFIQIVQVTQASRKYEKWSETLFHGEADGMDSGMGKMDVAA